MVGCLRVDPAERPENAAAALALLESSAASARARGREPASPTSRPRRAWRMKLAASLAAPLVLAAVGVWWWGGRKPPSTDGTGPGTTERTSLAGTVEGGDVGLSAETDENGRARMRLGPLEAESDADGSSKLKIRGLTLRTDTGGSSAVSAAGVVVDASDVTRVVTCSGDDVHVGGSGNTLRLAGECRQVTVSGDRNVLTIESAAEITALGHGNHVVWEQGVGAQAPRISNRGSNNSIRQAAR